jgi:O-acetyl-ADP-ribose deacetylase (regulator of RNase III)
MVRVVYGDLFASGAEAFVNPVNCVGVMGKGIAAVFKSEFPAAFRSYKEACDRGEVRPGHMFLINLPSRPWPRLLIHFPTKRHWRDSSRIGDIDSGLVALRQTIIDQDVHSVAMPALGCGLGGLPWNDVRRRIESALSDIADTDIYLFATK